MDQTLTGNLAKLGNSDLIVVKIDSTKVDNKDIQKAYAIEIKYNSLNANKDYSLKNAGITKLDYNDDSSVAAYVGKNI